MKLSFVAIFAFAAVAFGNVVESLSVPGILTSDPEKASDRFLRKHKSAKKAKTSKKSDEAVVGSLKHVELEEVGIVLEFSEDSGRQPTAEEMEYFTDAFMTAYEKTDEELQYEADVAILSSLDPTEPDLDEHGRKLGFWSCKLFGREISLVCITCD